MNWKRELAVGLIIACTVAGLTVTGMRAYQWWEEAMVISSMTSSAPPQPTERNNCRCRCEGDYGY